jgi:hypothetical protein
MDDVGATNVGDVDADIVDIRKGGMVHDKVAKGWNGEDGGRFEVFQKLGIMVYHVERPLS